MKNITAMMGIATLMISACFLNNEGIISIIALAGTIAGALICYIASKKDMPADQSNSMSR